MSEPTEADPSVGVTRSIPLTPARQWRAFWVCVAVAAITILDLTKVNVALPSIETAFGAASTELQLIVSGYVLAFGLFLVPMGRIGDLRSRRALFLMGLAGFTVASLLAALAPNATVLLIARLLQGIAAGTQMPQVIGLIQQLFQGRERARAFGLFGATIGISTAFGPMLGGLMIALGGAQDGWRWIFWMNIPLGVAAIGLALWVLPETRMRSHRRLDMDPVGIALFGVLVVSLMWPFLFTTGSPDDDPARWWVLVAAAVFGVAFVLWEVRYARRGRQALIPFGLFRITSYRNGTALQAVYFMAIPPMFLLTTLFLQLGLGLAPVFAGMVTIGFALTSAGSSWLGGRLVARMGRPLVLWGMVLVLLCAAGLVATAWFAPDAAAPLLMAACMVVGGIGGGFVVSPNQALTLAEVPVSQGGVAGSVGQLGQRIGTAVGIAISLALFYATIYGERDAGVTGPAVFHDAYGRGMLAVAGFLTVALAVAVLDLLERRRSGTVAALS